ncbi:RNA polymerase sigma factor [Mesorhizobium sp. YIM 152430]|jgi:RNA polymerase sigma-70 factor, ECF subfamily|uniref:RNA polymerase sigma factor n=1 Tax=Mesorhizobium sp. YIM 152430 TaxID=3031761 RepID=UPI0023DA3C9E|nr:RNA polymerase sigma factor [Mesorhizobium sp. YIM 152430]MDF1598218.1 RNA polymerase sigma factor [Mesorhizobium sp. YIM 152430]
MTSPPNDIGDQLIAFLPNMRRFALSLSRAPDIADDLVQQACERALANAASFEPGTRFDAWIFRIIRNLWIDRTRRQKTAGPSEDVYERQDLVGEDGQQVVDARQALTSVKEALDAMPEEQRAIVMLVCVDDLSYRDAAEVLGVPIGTVMSRLARARKRLAEMTGINPAPGRSTGARD